MLYRHGIEVTEDQHILLGNRKLVVENNISLEELAETSDKLAAEVRHPCILLLIASIWYYCGSHTVT